MIDIRCEFERVDEWMEKVNHKGKLELVRDLCNQRFHMPQASLHQHGPDYLDPPGKPEGLYKFVQAIKRLFLLLQSFS